VWVAGLTADLSKLEGEVGQMRGFPLVGGFLRASASSRWSGGPRPLGGGQRFSGHLTISDVYWMILDALSHHIPGQGRPPGPSGGQAYPGLWRGVQGSPGGEGAERDSPDISYHRIPGPIGTEKTNSGESDVQKTIESLLITSSPSNP
jgi:hypothetical protein